MTITANNNTFVLPDKQHRDLACFDLSKNYLVEAGAGTGKTTILVERILNIITSGKAEIGEIVAITFTEKAATELLTRLQDGLEKRMIQSVTSGNPEQYKLCKKALDSFTSNRISTIHSFCRSLLGEKPFAAGIDPKPEIDDVKDTKMMQENLDDWMGNILSIDEHPFRIALEMGVKEDSLIRFVDFVYSNRDCFKDFIKSIGPQTSYIDICEKYFNKLASDYAELNQCLTCCIKQDDKGAAAIRSFIRDFDNLKDENEKVKIRWIFEHKGFKGQGNKSNWKPSNICADQKELFKEMEEERLEVEQKLSDSIIFECLRSLDGFLESIEDTKFNMGLLGFDDLLIKARDLLRDDFAARDYFKRKFRYLLVDEFQDTDPLQAEIVFFLAEKRSAGGLTPGSTELCKFWDMCIPESGKLFVVGDPKQSIYRFRRADIEIYEKVKRLIVKNGGEVLNIVVNFRSLSPIIDWVNIHFGHVMHKPDDGNYQADYISLAPFRKNTMDHKTLFVLEADETLDEMRGSAEGIRTVEACMTAEFVDELINRRKYGIRDREGNERELEYRDITILFPRTTNIEIYEDALAARNIPTLLEAGYMFFRRQEIIDLLNILKAIDNPMDEIAVASVLKSAFWSLNDEDLMQISQNKCSFNYLEDFETLPDYLKEPFKKLSEYHNLRSTVSYASLLEQMIADTGYREYWAVTLDNPRPLANIEKFISLARDYHLQYRGTISEFITYIAGKIDDEEKEADSPLADSNQNAVRLMTMHKSKGLEFPVVIPVNMMGKKPPAKSGTCFYDRENQKFGANLTPFCTTEYEELKTMEDKKLLAEELRLVYVACTRAVNILALPAFSSVKGFENMQKCLSATLEVFTGKSVVSENPFESAVAQIIENMFESILYNDSILNKKKPGLKKLRHFDPPGGIADIFGVELQKWEADKKSIIDTSSQTDVLVSYSREKAGGDDSRAWKDSVSVKIGRAYHKVMETISFSDKSYVEEAAAIAAALEGVDNHREKIVDMVMKTLDSEAITFALGAGKYQKEYPFIFTDNGTEVTGCIDLLIQENDGFTIVDYKSDNIKSDKILYSIEYNYKRQIEVYTQAVEKLTGTKPKAMWFYFAVPDVVHKVTF
ncbi:MAG: UvrD-helicase domain-containing protein [Firmicutes bacterium]|nr:UvrD-helicase domain-containing protein [Bacillota bacterium]